MVSSNKRWMNHRVVDAHNSSDRKRAELRLRIQDIGAEETAYIERRIQRRAIGKIKIEERLQQVGMKS